MEGSTSAIIDNAKLRPIHWWLIGISAVGLLFDGFDFQATAYAAPLIKAEWSLDPRTLGGLISAGFFGLFFGSIGASYVADLVGRKKAFVLCTLLYSIFTAAAAFAPNFTWFIAFRFLTGLGLGGLVPVSVAWLMEFLPARQRTAITAAVIACFMFGWIVASGAALLVIPHFGWRMFFIIGALPALLAVPIAIWGQESPLWLISRERKEEALAVLRRINPAASLTDAGGVHLAKRDTNWLILFSAPRIRTTIILATMYFLIAAVSAGILQWLPSLLIGRGISMQNTYAYSLVISVGPIIGTVILGMMLDAWGRRLSYVLFWIGASGFTILFAFASSPGWVMFLGFGLTFFVVAAFGCLDVITAELYPTELRSSAVGFGLGLSRLGGAFGPVLGGYLISGGISYSTFFLVFALPPLINVALTFGLKFAAQVPESSPHSVALERRLSPEKQ